MFTPRGKSGLQVTLAPTLLAVSIGLAGAAALTVSIWFAAGSGASVMLAAVAWFWTRRVEEAEATPPVARASPGFTDEAYAFREWEATPRMDRVSAGYPQNLAREVLEAPRVYGQAAEAPRASAPPPRQAAPPVRHWEPGAAPAPPAFRDAGSGEELVEFQVVNPATSRPVAVAAPTTPVATAEIPVERPSSQFVPDLHGSKHADFYDRKPRYEKVGLEQEMRRRRERMARDLPLVGSMLTDQPRPEPRESHPGKTRGKCSKCSTYLWAPAKRPLRVRCPTCGHEARLT